MKNLLLIISLFLLQNAHAQIAETYWSYEGDPTVIHYQMLDTTSGKIYEEGKFTHGLRDGTWIRYSLDGAVQNVAYFHHGKKTGTWKFYNEDGKVVMLKKYKNDHLVLAEERRYY